VLPLDRSGINFQQEAPRPAARPQLAPRAQQSHRAHQGRGRSQGGQGRSGSSRRVWSGRSSGPGFGPVLAREEICAPEQDPKPGPMPAP